MGSAFHNCYFKLSKVPVSLDDRKCYVYFREILQVLYQCHTESGLNNKARWGGQYFKWWLEEQPGYAMYTRYPQ